MGDVRFRNPYMRLQRAQDRVAELRRLHDEEVVEALGYAAAREDPLVANVLATEALNRLRRSREMMRHLAEGVVALDADGRVIAANPAAERLLGWGASALLGEPFAEVVAARRIPANPKGEAAALDEPLVRERLLEGEARFRRADGKDVEVAFVAAPVMDDGKPTGAVVSFRDLGQRKEVERREGVVRRVAELLAETRSVDEVLQGLPKLLVPDLADACALYLQNVDGALERVVVHDDDADRRAALHGIEAASPAPVPELPAVRELLARGEPCVVADVDDAARLANPAEAPRIRLLQRLGFRSVVTLPLRARGRILGALELARAAERPPFAQRDLLHLEPIAGRVALALDNARLDDELRASHERYELVARGAGDGIWDWDTRTGRVFYSPRWLEVLGYAPGDLPDTPEAWASLVHPEDRAVAEQRLADFLAGRVPEYRLEHRLRHKDGTYRWMLSRAVLLRDAEGRPVRLVGSNADVTREKRAEANLRESRERFRSLFENSPYGVLTLGLDGIIQDVNEASLRATGHSRDEVVGAHFITFVPEEDHAHVLELFRAVVEGKPHPARFRIRHTDGRLLDVEAAGVPVVVDGEVVGVHGLWRDKTEELRWQEALLSSDERYRELFESVLDVVYALDREGRYVAMNPAFTQVLGWDREEWIGRSFAPLIHPNDEARARETFHGALSGSPQRAELDVRRSDGQYVRLEIHASPRRHGEDIVGVFGVARDVTERRRHEEDLERRVAERTTDLAEALRDLQTFTDSVSHDLRAPLRGVATLLELLDDDVGRDLPAESREVLQRARREATRATRLVQDLLAFSRSGKETLRPVEVDVSGMARDLAAEIDREHPEWGTRWRIRPDLAARADAGLLRIVLSNLLHNAAKYGARGAPPHDVDVLVETRDGERWYVVRDHGVGFPMTEAWRLFRPFARLSTAADIEGTGLGLATVARIVARHGGRIETESAPGRGATFRFTLAPPGDEAGRASEETPQRAKGSPGKDL